MASDDATMVSKSIGKVKAKHTIYKIGKWGYITCGKEKWCTGAMSIWQVPLSESE